MWMAMVFPSQDRHYTKLSTLSFELSHSNRYLYLSIGFFHQARRNVSSILHIAKLARPMDKYFYMNIISTSTWIYDIEILPKFHDTKGEPTKGPRKQSIQLFDTNILFKYQTVVWIAFARFLKKKLMWSLSQHETLDYSKILRSLSWSYLCGMVI